MALGSTLIAFKYSNKLKKIKNLATSPKQLSFLTMLLKVVNHIQMIAFYQAKLPNDLKETFIKYVFPALPWR